MENDEAGGIGRSDFSMGVIHAGAGIHIKEIAMDEDRAVGAVVGPDTGVGHHIEEPEDIRVGAGEGDLVRAFGGVMGRFVAVGAVVAVL